MGNGILYLDGDTDKVLLNGCYLDSFPDDVILLKYSC